MKEIGERRGEIQRQRSDLHWKWNQEWDRWQFDTKRNKEERNVFERIHETLLRNDFKCQWVCSGHIYNKMNQLKEEILEERERLVIANNQTIDVLEFWEENKRRNHWRMMTKTTFHKSFKERLKKTINNTSDVNNRTIYSLLNNSNNCYIYQTCKLVKLVWHRWRRDWSNRNRRKCISWWCNWTENGVFISKAKKEEQ